MMTSRTLVHVEMQRTQESQSNLEKKKKKNEVRRLTPPYFKTYHKATLTQYGGAVLKRDIDCDGRFRVSGPSPFFNQTLI